MEEYNYSWVDFYKEFANILLTYKDQRDLLIEKVKAIFAESGISMPTLELDNKIVDIDPFTVFGLFNKSSMREENRIKIITAVKEIFDVQASVPTSFNSIPVLNNQNATFYYFSDSRAEGDIDELWSFFEAALRYSEQGTDANRATLEEYFDRVIHKKGNGNSKITMGLYWIAPDKFMNLDSRNEWYIYESGKLPASVIEGLPTIEPKISAKKYFTIIEILRAYLNSSDSDIKNFKELSFNAWTYSNEVNEQQRKQEKMSGSRNLIGSGLADEDVDVVRYWLYSPGENASKWNDFYARGVMGVGWSEIGDYSQYSSKEEMRIAMKERIDPNKSFTVAALAPWQFLNDMKCGDIIFAKRGTHTVIAKGIVTSDYMYDTTDKEYPNVRKVKWISVGDRPHPGRAPVKTLTDVSAFTEYIAELNALYESEEDTGETGPQDVTYPEYSPEKFLEEVYMDGDSYDTLVDLIRMKKNVILQGAPGVGKTFAAKRLAYSMMGCKNQNQVMMVQFHQSYTYEDFIEGFRPSSSGDGFEIKKGSFYNFCKKAADDLDNEYFFIIDEINRGNLSKIFGELFMLIESDKRGNALQLLYSDEKFYVPGNVYIIGMMNTADRSLAMLDYALRRRFAFFEMKPGFESEGFRKYKMALESRKFDKLIDCVESLNRVIESDDSLGEGFCIGHSYFCSISEVTDRVLSNIVEYELIPLLKEYWYDEPIKVKDWSETLRSSIK